MSDTRITTLGAPRCPKNLNPLPTPASPQEAWLCGRRGRAVTVRLVDGKTLTGTLVAWDVYTLHLAATGRGVPTLVYKHAVAYLTAHESGASG